MLDILYFTNGWAIGLGGQIYEKPPNENGN